MNDTTTRYGQIRARGEDAAAFFSAQLTRRVDDLAHGESRLAAWCNAKGRVQALFRISRTDDGYDLRLPALLVPLTLPRLRMFVLRSRVMLDEVTPASDDTIDRLAEIRAGIPEIYPETREQFLPQMLNLDKLNAIDFKKGCYPGQEIVARMQYLGQLKRRMYLFSAEDGTPPTPGSALLCDDESSGTVVDAARDENDRILIQGVIPIEAAQQTWRLAKTQRPLRFLDCPIAQPGGF